MIGGEVNSYPIQLLVNYWEICPSLMGARLDEFLRSGIRHLASYVPWQVVESDISHSLFRFLQAASERKMSVALILTPEVGIHYPNSGLPKDLLSKSENMAQHSQRGQVTVNLPPNIFSLPSLFAQDFTKRYYSFLSRMDSLLADFERSQPSGLKGVSIVLTGSFWKYFRSPRDSARNAFGGIAGDYSGAAAIAFRQTIDHHFSQPEFSDPTPASAHRWKARALEENNRRWFYQQSEAVFRNRTYQLLRRKANFLKISEIELYTPEADPGLSYSLFLQMISGGHADFSRLSAFIDEASSLASMGSQGRAVPFIRWTSLGGFRSLTDSEKQFLILKSLLLAGGQGGGLLLDEEEWFSLSQNFRSKAEAFARFIVHGELRLQTRALYLAPHLWSHPEMCWRDLVQKVGPGTKLISNIDTAIRERDSSLLIVDPSYILTREIVQQLCAWAEVGRILVLPQTPLFTESAQAELDRITRRSKAIHMDMGVSYRLLPLGSGKLIVYDPPRAIHATQEAASLWQKFVSGILAIAGVERECKLSDSRLNAIPLKRRDGTLGIFVMNGSSRPVTADIVFSKEAEVSDLAVAVSAPHQAQMSGMVPATRFSLEVPSCGVLPLAVSGLSGDEVDPTLVVPKTEIPAEELWN